MSVEFIGYIGAHNASETVPNSGPAIDREHVETVARAHEAGGFDRALVAFGSSSPESQLVVAHAASVTQRLGFMIAHRPGFTAPTLAARQLATLDQFTDEYLDIVRREWTSETPFDYSGRYYQVEQAFGGVKPVQKPHIPIYFGGSSDAAIPVAGKHADIYALWGESQAQVREWVARIRAAAAKHGRRIGFSLSLRPVIADTEEAAWKRADEIVERVRELRLAAGQPISGHTPPNAGSQRLLETAARGRRVDKRLWTGVTALTGAAGNSTGLVGTPEQVAESLLDYYDLGVTTFLIRGFDPLPDAVAYGRDLIPLVRELVADRRRVVAAE
jgi:alkanesulfonate monooxygenase